MNYNSDRKKKKATKTETNLGLSGLFKIPNREGLSCLWLPHPQRPHLGHGWRQSWILAILWGDRDVEKFGESDRATTSVEQEMEIKGFVYRLDPKPDYVLMNFLSIQEGKWGGRSWFCFHWALPPAPLPLPPLFLPKDLRKDRGDCLWEEHIKQKYWTEREAWFPIRGT